MARSAVEWHRRRSRGARRLIWTVAGAMAFVAAVPAVASAQLTITSVNLTRTSGPPGALLAGGVRNVTSGTGALSPSTVTVTRTGTSLGGIRWTIRNSNGDAVETSCVATTAANPVNISTAGTPAANRGPVLPRNPGSYSVSFQAFSNSSCTTAGGNVFAGGTVTVNREVDNPNIGLRCGLKVALVLDESSSIQAGAQEAAVRDATTGFVTALAGTGSQVQIIAFAQRARAKSTS